MIICQPPHHVQLTQSRNNNLLNHIKRGPIISHWWMPILFNAVFSVNIPRFHSSFHSILSLFLGEYQLESNWGKPQLGFPSLHPQPPSMSTLSSTDSWPVEKSVGQNYPHPETISKSTCKRVLSFGGGGGCFAVSFREGRWLFLKYGFYDFSSSNQEPSILQAVEFQGEN